LVVAEGETAPASYLSELKMVSSEKPGQLLRRVGFASSRAARDINDFEGAFSSSLLQLRFQCLNRPPTPLKDGSNSS